MNASSLDSILPLFDVDRVLWSSERFQENEWQLFCNHTSQSLHLCQFSSDYDSSWPLVKLSSMHWVSPFLLTFFGDENKFDFIAWFFKWGELKSSFGVSFFSPLKQTHSNHIRSYIMPPTFYLWILSWFLAYSLLLLFYNC